MACSISWVGYSDYSGQYLATVYAYNPATDTWTSEAPLPSPRAQSSIAVANGILYAIGGYASAGPIADVEAYDPNTNAWTAKAPLPVPRWASVAGVVNGIIYIAAGNDLNGPATTTTYAYDPSADAWTSMAPIPTGRSGSATGGVINGILYVVGGCAVPAPALNTVEAYNPATNTWAEMSPMPTARFYLSGGVIGNTLYALGGTTQGAYASYYALATNEAFTPPDTTPPDITITSPTAATYLLNQAVPCAYSCGDSDDTVTVCAGPVPNGADIDTASIGARTFTVNATDSHGNSSSSSVNYSVAYNICALYDQTHSVKSGATIPIKLELCDSNGADQSASAIVVHATGVAMASTNASETLQDAGNANADDDFRFDSTLGTTGGYIFNLSTKGYPTGSFKLQFTAGGDPTIHITQFQVK